MLSVRRRRGATLAELLVAIALGGIVLGTATSTLLRQQRTAASVGRAAGEDAQLRAALGALSVELAALTTGAGDLAPGQATDTAIQLRGLVASGITCADAVGSATLADEDDSAGGSLGAVPRAGDSVWWFGGAPAAWRAARVAASDSVSAPCPVTSTPPAPARRITLASPESVTYGAPLRVTRPIRYAFYRSGDGSWQLGVRDWSEATGHFASPQPIAGPFVMRAGSARSGFRYYDAAGMELGTNGAAVVSSRVARIRVTVLAVEGTNGGTDGGARRDSVDVALQPQAGP